MTLDPWWNRNFPARSPRRLVFGLVAVPIIAVAVAALRNAAFETPLRLPQIAVVTVMGMGVVVVGWLLAREEGRAQPRRSWWRPDPFQDFLYATAIAFISFSAMNISFLGSDASGTGLLMTLGAAVAFSLVLVARFSIWSVVAVAIAAGYPIGAVVHFFLYWFGGDYGVAEYWAIASLLVLVFLAPVWLRVRAMRHIFERIPLWVIALVATLPLGLMVGFVEAGYFGSDSAAVSGGETGSPAGESLPAGFGRPTPEIASIQLMNAWRAGDRSMAASVARTAAVDALLADRFPTTTVFKGCGTVPEGWVRCVLALPGGLVLLAPERTSEGTFYISDIERVALTYPIELDREGASPSPTS